MASVRQPFNAIYFKTRFPALDGIRALAVTLVFALHYGGGGTHGGRILKSMDSIRKYGFVGVDLFFVLSGFLITGILFDTRRDSHFFKRFFVRRSVRIFPIVYLLFAILALLTPIVHYQWHWQQAFFLVYLGNFFANANFSLYSILSPAHPAAQASIAHLWSLCVEEQFYMLWPIVVWLIRDRVKLVRTCMILCVLTVVLRVTVIMVWPAFPAQVWMGRSLPFCLDDLLLGALLALLLRGPWADRVQRSMKWFFFVGLAAIVVTEWFPPWPIATWGLTCQPPLIGITAMGLIGMTLRQGSPAYRLFSLRPLVVLGKYSYGFYVWHAVWFWAWVQLLIYLTNRFHSPAIGGVISLPITFATTFLMAKLSYDVYEVRFLKWKRNFEYDSELRTHKTAFATDGN